MRKRYGFGILIILSIMMIEVCGCTMSNSDLPQNTKSEVSLSERQISILSEQGLSTEYDELTLSQQRAIVSIEEMLLYVENKYNTSFSYAGYTAASSLEKESMRAYLTSGDKGTDCFTITKTEDGYDDDYVNHFVREGFAAYICESLKTVYPNIEIMVFTEITETSLCEVPVVGTDYDGKVESSLWIFVDEASFKKESIDVFKDEFVRFMNEHQLFGMTQIVLLKEGEFAYLTGYNYTDYLSEEHYLRRETVYVNR